ncbi:MAG: DUF1553 domain-containing protein [Planctomycetaceae bacterium]|nr:DUF1553 domain-containing protein [Planctomycetaceae bacterium]
MTANGAENESKDSLLESCLEEVLGGHTPPDLKEKILAQHADQSRITPPPTSVSPAAPPVQSKLRSVNANNRNRVRSFSRSQQLATILIATTAIGFVAIVGFLNFPSSTKTKQPDVANLKADPVLTPPEPTDFISPIEPELADTSPKVTPPSTNPSEAAVVATPTTTRPETAPESTAAPERLPNEEIVNLINAQIQRGQQIAKIEPAALINDETWCRRVYQRVLGRTASDEELRRFNRMNGDRRQALLHDLFTDGRYRKEYASHWATIWTNQLLSNPGDTKNANSLRAGLRRHLQATFQQGQTHDQWAANLITAEGSNSVQADDFNGATNYLLAFRDNQDSSQIAAEVCRVLLGQRVRCAQCHNNEQDQQDQQEFWQLAAFFRQLNFDVLRPGIARLVDRDFAGDPGADAGAVRFQRHEDGKWQEVFPRFWDEPILDSDGKLADGNRREEFAKAMVDSPMFSAAAVNHVWSQLLAFGFTSPVDDMGRHNPAAHPELLTSLAEQFELHEFETSELIRWIVMSEPFNRSQVITAANGKDAPQLGSTAYFSRFYHRPVLFSNTTNGLAGLQDGKALLAMDQVPGIDVMLNAQIQPLLDKEQLSNRKPKANANSFGKQLSSGHQRLAASLAKSSMPSNQKVEHVFLAILGRKPKTTELEQSVAIYEAAKPADRTTAVEQLIWALTRTEEFVSLH